MVVAPVGAHPVRDALAGTREKAIAHKVRSYPYFAGAGFRWPQASQVRASREP
jgi:hypothetical protein